jgi:hypothetical protein
VPQIAAMLTMLDEKSEGIWSLIKIVHMRQEREIRTVFNFYIRKVYLLDWKHSFAAEYVSKCLQSSCEEEK